MVIHIYDIVGKINLNSGSDLMWLMDFLMARAEDRVVLIPSLHIFTTGLTSLVIGMLELPNLSFASKYPLISPGTAIAPPPVK